METRATRSRKRQLDPPAADTSSAPAKRATRRSTNPTLPTSTSEQPKQEQPQQPAQPASGTSAPPAQRGRRSARVARTLAAPPSREAPQQEVPAASAEPKEQAPAAGQQSNTAPSQRNLPQKAEPEPMAGRGRDDEDDMARNLSSASNALQGLLRKLGAGFDDAFLAMGGMSGGRFKNIIMDLRQAEDENAQLNALTELCELLAISSEDNLTTFPVDTAVPLLVSSLNMEHNPDIMLLAARALTFLADMLPQACGSIVRHGAVTSFCQRLLTIEYIDLAEQSLLALEKLSHEHSHALLQRGGLLAVLSYLDFFPSGVQRVAVATAANMCRGLTSDNASAVQEAVPILTNLLQYQDAKVVDNACLALSNIAESYANKPQLLAMLSTGGLITQALQLVSLSENGTCSAQLSLTTYYSLIKLLSYCSAKCPAVAQQLLEGQLLGTLHTLLATSSIVSGSGNTQTTLRSPDQLYEVVSLLCELLPAVGSPSSMVLEEQHVPGAQGAGASTSSATAAKDERNTFFDSRPEAAQAACHQLVPLMMQVYASSVIPHVRQQCLSTLLRLLAMASPSMLQEGLRSTPISSFIGSLLAHKDLATQATGLLLAEVCMAKLPDVFKVHFIKEGVVQALQLMASKATPPAAATAAAAAAPTVAPGAGEVKQEEGEGVPASQSPPPRAAAAPASTSEAASKRVTRSSSRQRDSMSGAKEPAGPPPPGSGSGAAGSSRGPSPGSAKAPTPPPPLRPRGASPFKQQPPGDAPGSGQEPNPPPAPPAPAPASSAVLSGKLANRAAAFCTQWLGDCSPGSDSLKTEGMKQLQAAAQALGADPRSAEALLQLLSRGVVPASNLHGDISMMGTEEQGAEEDAISAFELLNSGAIKALADYLQGTDLPQDEHVEAALVSRLSAFVKVALATGSGEQPLLSTVVRKLQAALASAETFQVLLSRVPTGTAAGSSGIRGGGSAGPGRAGGMMGGGSQAMASSMGSYRSGLAALSRPFKLRLCRHSAERKLRDYGSNVVLIEPLASMGTIEDFLYPRVCQSNVPPSARDPPAAAAAAANTSKPPDAAPSKAASPPAAAKAGGGSSSEPAAPLLPPASKAQPIPEDRAGNRRVTRAAAARARAAAASGNAGQEDEDGDVQMGTVGSAGSGLPVDDHDMEEEGHDELPPPGTYYDGDSEEYDEEYDGDEGADDMDLGSMHVHDLHVEDPPAAAAAGDAAAPGSTLPRTRSSPAQPAAAPGAGPASRRLATTASEPVAPPAAAATAQRAASASAWGTGAGGSDAGRGRGAAAAAALAEQPRLIFYSGDVQLATGTTVFQAIQQLMLNRPATNNGAGASGEGGEDGGNGCDRQMWDGIHTIHYRSVEPEDLGAGSTSSAPAASKASTTTSARSKVIGPLFAPVRSGLPLGAAAAVKQVMETALPADLRVQPACRDVLMLLELLDVLNRVGPRLCYAVDLEDEADTSSSSTAATTIIQPPHAPTTAAPGKAGCKPAPKEGAGQLAYGRVPRQELVSGQLTSKLSQQLKDVLSICGGGLPGWCKDLVFHCRHLISFDIRRRYFYCTALGLGRALQHMQALHANEAGGTATAGSASEREAQQMRVGRLQRQKVRVSRKRILESAVKVMELYASQRAVLELEYFGEVGTGLGPTLEFYTLLSHDLQRRALKLWRHEDAATHGDDNNGAGDNRMDVDGEGAEAVKGPIALAARGVLGQGAAPAVAAHTHVEVWHDDAQYVNAPWGLFPAPLPPSQRTSGSKVLEMYKLMGRAVAKALQDNRLMDLPLNYTFYRAIQGCPLDMYDIATFDPVLGQQLQKLWVALLAARKAAGDTSPPAPAPVKPVATTRGKRSSGKETAKGAAAPAAPATPVQVLVDGVAVEDLCLVFTLPGYPDYELIPGGADIMVDSSNLAAWIQAVTDATLGDGISSQLDNFCTGFNEVFPLSSLCAFYEDEIETLLCGSGEHWSVASLAAAIKFDHGYTPSSPVVLALLEVLSELEPHDQRRFLRFVTGCPRLPPGGLSALQPRLTVVRKHPSGEKAASKGGTPVGSLHQTSEDAPLGAGTVLADGDLPSVMTCANYIKLPPYSSKQVLRDRLLFAIREGQGSFDLS